MKCRRLIVLLGPTASGKTSLSITLAKRFHGIVISADSRQVYRGMNLGTGKVTKREMSGVPHYLLDVASPKSTYTVAKYVRDVTRVIKKISTSTPIFLVGGSPFYIDALTKPNSFSAVPPNPALRRRLDKLNTAPLMAHLLKMDPVRAKIIDPFNRRRLIRAIEIAFYKSPPRARKDAKVAAMPEMKILKLGVAINKAQLHRNIDHRVDVRMRQGMEWEVQRLHDSGVSWKKLDDFGLEYRFLSRYLRGQISKSDADSQLKFAIRHFAKRQMTWWKQDNEIHWISTSAGATAIIQKWIRE